MKSLFLLMLPIFLLACNRASQPEETVDSTANQIEVSDNEEPAGILFEFVGTAQLPSGFDAAGHRGARGLLPENMLPAFEAALDLGVTTLELDLHFTQDGEVVVWHDPLIDDAKCRLPDNPADPDAPNPKNPLRRIFISQQPLSVVQSYQCDLNADNGRFPTQTPHDMPLSGSDYRIITLNELFDFVEQYANSELKTAAQRANAANVQFNIETKRKPDNPEYIDDGFTGGEAGPFELAILEIVNGRSLTERVIIQSFDHRSLRTIRELDSDIRLAALTTGGEAKVQVYAGYKFNIWSPNKRDVTADLINAAHEEGLLVIPWTVNEVEEMQQLIAWGVDGLITDYPDRLLGLP
ncbi:Glycerophosphoryl diester phosphodiesterase [hydrothermal vent metagenome]|uniref:Glycerophosphoryl diester phosphodiesterase n=1 Tax=hydrothermal vent metagenome TaxID=652676 RepID=A0A3B0WG41_9ZZZZ